jgi:hypothetical protein
MILFRQHRNPHVELTDYETLSILFGSRSVQANYTVGNGFGSRFITVLGLTFGFDSFGQLKLVSRNNLGGELDSTE